MWYTKKRTAACNKGVANGKRVQKTDTESSRVTPLHFLVSTLDPPVLSLKFNLFSHCSGLALYVKHSVQSLVLVLVFSFMQEVRKGLAAIVYPSYDTKRAYVKMPAGCLFSFDNFVTRRVCHIVVLHPKRDYSVCLKSPSYKPRVSGTLPPCSTTFLFPA